MSDQEKEAPKRKAKNRKQAEEPIVATVSTRPDIPTSEKDPVKELFMASPFVEWSPFAESQNWNPQGSRIKYPVASWVAEKKRLIASAQAEKIAQAVFDHRGPWHQDVLSTLKEYPKANDAVLGLVKRRMNDMIEDANADADERLAAAREGRAPFSGGKTRKFDKWTNQDIAAISNAMRTVTDAKHRSLGLSNWTIKAAEEATNPTMLGAPPDDSVKAAEEQWTIQVIGEGQMTGRKLQDLMDRYLDKPGALGGAPDPIMAKAAEIGLEAPIEELRNPEIQDEEYYEDA